MHTGTTAFKDRTYSYNEIPSILVGADYLQTPNSDKTNATYSLTLSFTDTPYLVVLYLDSRLGSGVENQENPPTPPDLVAAGMTWVGTAGFVATDHIIEIKDMRSTAAPRTTGGKATASTSISPNRRRPTGLADFSAG